MTRPYASADWSLSLSKRRPCQKTNLLRKLLTIGLIFALNLTIFGTAQIPELMIYKGETYPFYYSPMDDFFEKYPEKKPAGSWSTDLYRGYVATFEIKNNQLFLKDIKVERRVSGLRYWFKNFWSVLKGGFGYLPWSEYFPWEYIAFRCFFGFWPNDFYVYVSWYQYKWVSVLNEVFPNQKSIKFDWVTGIFVLEDIDEEYGYYYEFEPPPPPPPRNDMEQIRYELNEKMIELWKNSQRYFLLEINEGNLTNVVRVEGYDTFQEVKDRQFDAFKKTEDYKRVKAERLASVLQYNSADSYWASDERIDRGIKREIFYHSSKILVDIQ